MASIACLKEFQERLFWLRKAEFLPNFFDPFHPNLSDYFFEISIVREQILKVSQSSQPTRQIFSNGYLLVIYFITF
jgi:hypothetical protein